MASTTRIIPESVAADPALLREHLRHEGQRTLAQFDLSVPRKYAGATLETFDLAHTPAGTADRATLERKLAMARDYVQGWPAHEADAAFPHVVAFCGAPGTGKTRLAYAIAREVTRRYAATAEVVTFPALVEELRAAWRRDRGEASTTAIIAQYQRAALLVVDDVSRHAVRGDFAEELYKLIEPREADMRPVILTSNHAPDDFLSVIDIANASRVNGSGGVWDFGTTSRREWEAAQRAAARAR